jgi:hypothetical protein
VLSAFVKYSEIHEWAAGIAAGKLLLCQITFIVCLEHFPANQSKARQKRDVLSVSAPPLEGCISIVVFSIDIKF